MIQGLFRLKKLDLGIDLGTSNTRLIDSRGSVLFDEPSICCFRGYDAAPAFLAAGKEAQLYQAKIAKPLKIVHPLKDGVLSDMTAARELLRFARRKAGIRSRSRVRPAIGVPADATQAEKRALSAAAADAGFLDPFLVPEPLLAARGLNMDTDEPTGQMVVDCGGGAMDIAVVSLGGLCATETLRTGGLGLDRAIVDHLHLNHRFQIGPRSAERLKLEVSEALQTGLDDCLVTVRGSDLASGLPKALTMPAAEFRALWLRFVREVAASVREALAHTPPELAQDIFNNGIRLTGGAAKTALIGAIISDEAGVPVHVEPEPELRVAKGLAITLQR